MPDRETPYAAPVQEFYTMRCAHRPARAQARRTRNNPGQRPAIVANSARQPLATLRPVLQILGSRIPGLTRVPRMPGDFRNAPLGFKASGAVRAPLRAASTPHVCTATTPPPGRPPMRPRQSHRGRKRCRPQQPARPPQPTQERPRPAAGGSFFAVCRNVARNRPAPYCGWKCSGPSC